MGGGTGCRTIHWGEWGHFEIFAGLDLVDDGWKRNPFAVKGLLVVARKEFDKFVEALVGVEDPIEAEEEGLLGVVGRE